MITDTTTPSQIELGSNGLPHSQISKTGASPSYAV